MKTLLVVLALLSPLAADAACTWTATERGALGVCDTTPVAPSANTDGILLGGVTFQPNVKGFVVHVETAGTMTAGGVIQAYLQNPITLQWNRVADGSLDFTTSAVGDQAFPGVTVNVSLGRLAYVASGVGVTANIYINAAY